MSSYYEDDDEIDVRIHRHGRASPQPVVYRERPRPAVQPVYYSHGTNYLVAERSDRRRSSSSHRVERAPAPPPVIINNYNDYEDDRRDEQFLQLARPVRSHSRSRPTSFSSVDYELEKTRKELEHFKMEATREKEKERLKNELEFKRLKEEKRRKEEEARAKKEAEEAVAKWQMEQEKKAAKEKKEKEEREKEYKERMETDMRKAGMDETQIAIVLKKEGAIEKSRPTYTRMSRRHLSIETLNVHRIEYTFDQDPDFILIKRWVPEWEQDILWKHTHELRERRRIVIQGRPQKEILLIEDHHHKHKKPEIELEFVRKKERKPSPSPLLTFLAGGKR